MPITKPICSFLLFAALAILGFAGAADSAGAGLRVLVGVAGAFAAAVAVIVEVERGDHTPPGNPWEVAR